MRFLRECRERARDGRKGTDSLILCERNTHEVWYVPPESGAHPRESSNRGTNQAASTEVTRMREQTWALS